MPDELASLRVLWDLYPDAVLMNAGRNHAKLAALVEEGYVQASECDAGVIYRLAPDRAAGLAAVARRIGLARKRGQLTDEPQR